MNGTEKRDGNGTERKISGKQLGVFLAIAFGVAYVLQIVASHFANSGRADGVTIFRTIMSVCMYAPFLAVLVARIPLKGMGWGLHLKGKLRWFCFAMWLPAACGTIGAGLYFLLFPSHFDTAFETLRQALGEAGMAQLEAQGLTVETYLVSNTVMAITIAPFLNCILGIGEEVGWRGGLYPALKERFGKTKGRILGGMIWGIWHWPCMIFAGYEYGKEYPGAPVAGLFAFCLSTIFMGILFDHVYEKTESIWMPGLMHGAINAFTIFAYLLKPEYADRMILGPTFVGVIGMIPMTGIAIWICLKETSRPNLKHS